MILPTAEIAAKTAQEKADLVKTGAKRMTESRYEVAIALALLGRSNGYLELGFETIEEFAAKEAGLEPGDWTQMLSVGRRALQFPEVDVAYRAGKLNWSKVRCLVPVLTKENVAEWIGKAGRMTSNQLERAVSQVRDPSVGGLNARADPRAPDLRALLGARERTAPRVGREQPEGRRVPQSALRRARGVPESRAPGAGGRAVQRLTATRPRAKPAYPRRHPKAGADPRALRV